MKVNLEDKLIAIIRVRGRIGVRRSINETLDRLNLNRVNSLSLIFGTKSNIGMIKKCNDFITYGEINRDALEKVLSRKGSKSSGDDVNMVLSGKKKARDVLEVPIRLKPPKHGYEGTKQGFSDGGALGYRGEKINELLSRMV
jgi:large subunit ribosomal protein L30